MIDLTTTTCQVPAHIEECLTDFAQRHGRAELMLYHTHPNYGQVHVYLSRNVDAQPYDDLIGQPIDYALDFDGWSEGDTWWPGEDALHPVLRLGSGEVITAKDNAEFNVLWAEHLDQVLRTCIPGLAPEICPARVIVQSENEEYVSDWRVNPV